MKKALIIGAAGFVGPHLIDAIEKSRDWEIYATKLPQEQMKRCTEGEDFAGKKGCPSEEHPGSKEHADKEVWHSQSYSRKLEIINLDILKQEEVNQLLQTVRPDYIFHLAAQSSVAASWRNPDQTVDINIKGSIHILEAARQLTGKPKILLIGSGEEYGYVKPEEVPLREGNAIRPGNLYAATKACQNMIGSIYARAYGMNVMMVRAFNHIGPGQSDIFVVSDFCKQAAECEAGIREAKIKVGNLEAKRDFTDVRDVVRAYLMLMESGKAGESYNVGSGHAVSIKELLDRILSMARLPIAIETDAGRLRPSDIPIIQADIGKLKAETGWKPEIPLERTIAETLEYWRGQYQK